VTHDPRYLARARRSIYLFDGRLVSANPVHLEVA